MEKLSIGASLISVCVCFLMYSGYLSEAEQVLLLLLQVPLALLDELLHRRRRRRDRRRREHRHRRRNVGHLFTRRITEHCESQEHTDTKTWLLLYAVTNLSPASTSKHWEALLKGEWLSFEWTFPAQKPFRSEKHADNHSCWLWFFHVWR